MDASKEMLYDVEWQSLRVRLLAENSNRGGFATVEGVRHNIYELQRYLDASLTVVEQYQRLWRSVNLMNAVLLGYGNKRWGKEEHTLVGNYRDQWSWQYKKLKSSGLAIPTWDWQKVKNDLQELAKRDHELLQMIKNNLKKRVATANRKEKLNIGGMRFRSELAFFLKLISEAENEAK